MRLSRRGRNPTWIFVTLLASTALPEGACDRTPAADAITDELVAADAAWLPSAEQVKWVKQAATPFASDTVSTSDADLAPFGRLVGDARVVGLGDATHGSAEFYRMKHRLVAYLAPRGFTVVALETGMAEARRLNDYVLTGRGDPRLALLGIGLFNTPEVRDLAEWMRAYNASGQGRVELWGFDAFHPAVSMDSVRAFVARADPAYLPALDSAYGTIRQLLPRSPAQFRFGKALRPWRDAAAAVVAHLEARRGDYVRSRDSMEVAWATQYARLVLQQGQQRVNKSIAGAIAVRDSQMAANVRWILAHHSGGTRCVVWAHDYHVSRGRGWMGALLEKEYPGQLRVFGFALGQGGYLLPRRPPVQEVAPLPPPGTFEYVFHAAGLPRFMLDLRSAAKASSGTWLYERHGFRTAGAAPMATGGLVLGRVFDAVIYFDRVTATRFLPPVRVPAPTRQ